jgi:PEGA domain
MPTRSSNRLTRVLALALFGFAARPALAQPAPATAATPAPGASQEPLSKSLKGMARAEFEAGNIVFDDGDFGSAKVKYQHAYDLSHDVRLIWNIALCERNLRHYSRAVAAIQRYQTEVGAALTPSDQQIAEEFVKSVRTFISSMTLLVSEPGAEVFVDDEKIGTAPLDAAVPLDVGAHRIRVRKAGFKDFTETRTTPGGTAFTVVAKLERDPHRGQVVIFAGAKDLIALDGKAVGQGRFEGPLASGGHTLRVTAPGMATYQGELVVQDGETRRVHISLNPVARSGEWAKIAWILGGAALVGAAAVTGAVLYHPAQVPPLQGSLGTFPLSFGGRR